MPSDLSSADRRGPLAGRPHRRALSTAVLTLATLGAGVLVLAGGDAAGQASTLAAAPPTADRVAHPRPVATPTPGAPARPPARDPFRPLYVPPAAATTTGTTPETGGTGSSGTSSGSGPVLVLPSGSGTGSGGSGSVPVLPGVGGTGLVPVPVVPVEPAPTASPVERRPLVLTGVETTGDTSTALFVLAGTPVRVPVSGSFGPADELLLLSVQQGPGTGQWTAVVKLRTGSPFDVVTGTPASVPAA